MQLLSLECVMRVHLGSRRFRTACESALQPGPATPALLLPVAPGEHYSSLTRLPWARTLTPSAPIARVFVDL